MPRFDSPTVPMAASNAIWCGCAQVFHAASSQEYDDFMYTAYYDDSGSPDESLAVVVAGFVASDEQWKHFERNWNETLNRFGISLFHMKEFAHSIGEFSRFKCNRADREWLLRQLLAHVRLRTRHSCGHAVLMQDYREVSQVYPLDSGLTPYALCGRTCVASVSAWAKRNGIPESSVLHVFEDGSKGRGKLIDRMLTDKGIRPEFRKKHECVQLQAADLFAYEVLAGNKAVFEKGVRDFEALRFPLRQLTVPDTQGIDMGVYTRADLETFCENAGILRKDALAARSVEASS